MSETLTWQAEGSPLAVRAVRKPGEDHTYIEFMRFGYRPNVYGYFTDLDLDSFIAFLGEMKSEVAP